MIKCNNIYINFIFFFVNYIDNLNKLFKIDFYNLLNKKI